MAKLTQLNDNFDKGYNTAANCAWTAIYQAMDDLPYRAPGFDDVDTILADLQDCIKGALEAEFEEWTM